MKKVLALLMMVLLMFSLTACGKSSQEEATWQDYTATGTSNVLEVKYIEQDGSAKNRFNAKSSPTENTVGVSVKVMCPYCDKVQSTVQQFFYDDISSKKLGNDSVPLSKKIMCEDWNLHGDPSSTEFVVSILLNRE